MLVIEFVGLPCSGKTKFYLKFKKELLKNKIRTKNYTDIFFKYSSKIINLSLIENVFLYLGYQIYLRNLKNIKKKNNTQNLQIKKKINFNFKYFLKKNTESKLELIKKKIINNIPHKDRKIFLILKKCVAKSPISLKKKKILKSRLTEEFIGFYLLKNLFSNDLVILNDEGIFQRVLSGVGNFENKNLKFIDKNISIMKKYFSNTIIFFTNSSLKEIKKRSNNRREGFKYTAINDKKIILWNRIFENFFKNYKRKNIFHISNKSMLKVYKKLINF